MKTLTGRKLQIATGTAGLAKHKVLKYRELFQKQGYELPPLEDGWENSQPKPVQTQQTKQTKPVQPKRGTGGGAGTELTNLLATFRILPSVNGDCGCKNHAKIMNQKGTAWCRKNIETIVGWLQQQAAKHKIPFARSAARVVVRLAIRIAERKEAQL